MREGEHACLDGRLECVAPGAGLVARAVDEVAAVGNHAGVDLGARDWSANCNRYIYMEIGQL